MFTRLAELRMRSMRAVTVLGVVARPPTHLIWCCARGSFSSSHIIFHADSLSPGQFQVKGAWDAAPSGFACAPEPLCIARISEIAGLLVLLMSTLLLTSRLPPWAWIVQSSSVSSDSPPRWSSVRGRLRLFAAVLLESILLSAKWRSERPRALKERQKRSAVVSGMP